MVDSGILPAPFGLLPKPLCWVDPSCKIEPTGSQSSNGRMDLLGAESAGAQKAAANRRRERVYTQSFMVLLQEGFVQS